jgi:hypothetical protein
MDMNSRAYLAISGAVFGIVAAPHLLRVVNGWPVEVGPWTAPTAVSWLGMIIPAALCTWAFRLASRKGA